MKSPYQLAASCAASLYHALWLGARGYCKPIPLPTWERQYRAGHWDYLDGLGELGHYMIIVGYISQSPRKPDIIDVGCGHGRLLRLLPPASFRTYVGVDFSTEAISRANRLGVEGAQFVRGDFETWTPTESADILVFNESLYNSPRPVEVLSRYCRALKENGRVIISMYEAPGRRFIWRRINSLLRRIDGLRIVHDSGHRWQVALFAQRSDIRRESR